MKVYVVFWNDFYGNDQFDGVFSSEEKAKEHIEKVSGNQLGSRSKSSFSIEECVMDTE